jgi:hypothetical protein
MGLWLRLWGGGLRRVGGKDLRLVLLWWKRERC